ncbi:MAG: ATP-binding cassette domain-containing protein [Opitutaceae bacterium]
MAGIAGLIGAGRTEMLRSLFGLEPVKSGKIRVGAYQGEASPGQRWSQGGLVSEDRKTEGLAQNSVDRGESHADSAHWAGTVAIHPAPPATGRLRAVDRGTADQVSRCRTGRGGSLRGKSTKVAIARLLHHDADIFLLDEPTRGIDVGSKAQIYALIDRLALGDPPTQSHPGRKQLPAGTARHSRIASLS